MHTNFFKKSKKKSIKNDTKLNNAPIKIRTMYNYQLTLDEKNYNTSSYIEVLDKKGNYIECPQVGKTVIYCINGEKFLYKLIDIDTNARNSSKNNVCVIIELVEKL